MAKNTNIVLPPRSVHQKWVMLSKLQSTKDQRIKVRFSNSMINLLLVDQLLITKEEIAMNLKNPTSEKIQISKIMKSQILVNSIPV